MGFWLLVPGVGMGGGAVAAVLPNLCFTLDSNRPEFTLPFSPESTLEDNRTEFTLEN